MNRIRAENQNAISKRFDFYFDVVIHVVRTRRYKVVTRQELKTIEKIKLNYELVKCGERILFLLLLLFSVERARNCDIVGVNIRSDDNKIEANF